MPTLRDKEYFKKNGIIKLNLFDKSLLKNYRKKIISTVANTFNLEQSKNENEFASLEVKNKDLWSGMFKNIICMEDMQTIIKRSFKIAKSSIFGISQPCLCNTPNLKINFPNEKKHDLDAHQDIHSHLGSLNSITLWIPLQHTKKEIGPIEYIPGSHKKIQKAKSGILLKSFKESDYRSFELKLGECLVFSQLLIHRSQKNISKIARISLQIRFNDLSSEEWKKRNYYSIEKKYREKPNSNIKKLFLIK